MDEWVLVEEEPIRATAEAGLIVTLGRKDGDEWADVRQYTVSVYGGSTGGLFALSDAGELDDDVKSAAETIARVALSLDLTDADGR